MADNATSPLLGPESDREERPISRQSKASSHSSRLRTSVVSDESTPLLLREVDAEEDHASSRAAASLQSIQDGGSGSTKPGRRWPTIVALSILSAVVITILGLGFAMPAAVEEYTKAAAVFEPTDLSIDSFTQNGVKAKIRGNFWMDASRVHKKPVRDLGKFGTWIAKAVEIQESHAKVYLPEYGNVLLGSTTIPPFTIDIRNGHTTLIDILVDLERGDVEGIRLIANDWLEGRLGQLRVLAQAEVPVKSGLFNLGTQKISESLVLQGQ
jgi:hypothetical protein